MQVFLYILSHNIAPILLIVAIGYLLGSNFKLDVQTLSKLNFYVFVPAFTFYQIYTTVLPSSILKVFLFAIALLLINYLAAQVIGKLRRQDVSMRNAFSNAMMFYNSGNIGIPLITLVFSGVPFIVNGETPYLNAALSIQVIVLVVQNFTTNTVGFYNAGIGQKMNWKDSLLSVFKMPTIYSVPLAFLFKFFLPYDLREFFLWPAFEYMKNGLVPVSLFTLGVQLSKTRLTQLPSADVWIAVAGRLFGGPLIALGLTFLFRLDPLTSLVLMISSCVPTALNTALIAVDRNNQPLFASQTVLLTTVLCPITIAVVVYISQFLFVI